MCYILIPMSMHVGLRRKKREKKGSCRFCKEHKKDQNSDTTLPFNHLILKW